VASEELSCRNAKTADFRRLEMALAAVAETEKADARKSHNLAIRNALAIDIAGVK